MPDDPRNGYVGILIESKAAMDLETALSVKFLGYNIHVDLVDDIEPETPTFLLTWTDGPPPAKIGNEIWSITKDGHPVFSDKCLFLYDHKFSYGGVSSENGVLRIEPPRNVILISSAKDRRP